MTTFLSTFLPSSFRSQYWFIDNNLSYFSFETSLFRNDFVLISQFYSYAASKEVIEETYAFLSRLDLGVSSG